jgi:protocatechuate 3,4-dioxygenase beta subunit
MKSDPANIFSFPGVSRREALRLMGAGTAVMAGLPAMGTLALAQTPSCVVTPVQGVGPFFVDTKLNRADLRLDPANGSTRKGVPLRLRLQVFQVGSSSCTPLPGATVDLWQCDAEGYYSGVQDERYDTRGRKFLRGYQRTDAGGKAEFVTIYPGWYPGRTVHIHFKVRTQTAAGRVAEFASQWYMDDAITDQVHAQAPYSARGRRDTTNATDRGFSTRGGEQLTLHLTRSGEGYLASFDIGMRQT